MSKKIPPEGVECLGSDERVRRYADRYRHLLTDAALTSFAARCDKSGLSFREDELAVFAALDHPDKVQYFLNEDVYYNNDHASPDQEETAMPPRRVLQTGMAHCFEGAMFAYAVLHMHNYEPRLVMIEASQDSEHNLVVWREPGTGLYGCCAHSSFPHLDGREARYATLRNLAESYVPFYYSDRTKNPNDLTMVGFSDEVDIVARFGEGWIASDADLWDIYHTNVDDTWRFHYVHDNDGPSHLHPMIRAIKERWIDFDANNAPFINVENLSDEARGLWDAFWSEHGPNDERRPRGRAHEIEKRFMKLTGTTPIDLEDNAYDFIFFLKAGYRIESLLTRP